MLLLIPHLLEFQPSAILVFLLQSPLMHFLCFIKVHISLQLLLIRILPLLRLQLLFLSFYLSGLMLPLLLLLVIVTTILSLLLR